MSTQTTITKLRQSSASPRNHYGNRVILFAVIFEDGSECSFTRVTIIDQSLDCDERGDHNKGGARRFTITYVRYGSEVLFRGDEEDVTFDNLKDAKAKAMQLANARHWKTKA